ncbi:RNA polymerase sigma factor [Zunongwangia sp. H14]|uniref:RNA polymerase sigma factor n=1 Tax=Zunongwangia sp. H14 TaxID=3240792 RepID=UPI0035640535
MNQYTEEYYIDKAVHGDTRAFGVLVEKYQDYIFTIVYRMLKVREEAEEVAQDAFLKAFEALPGFRGESKFSSWLYRIAYRKALDRIRKNSRHTSLELIEEITADDATKLESGLEVMLEQERSEIIQKCLLKLPEQDAAIVTLYYFEEQPVKEIAGITGLTEDNVKVKLYRSRKALFSLLKKYMLKEIPEKNGKSI